MDRKHFTFVESMKGLISLRGLYDLLPASAFSCVLERGGLLASSIIDGRGITPACACACARV